MNSQHSGHEAQGAGRKSARKRFYRRWRARPSRSPWTVGPATHDALNDLRQTFAVARGKCRECESARRRTECVSVGRAKARNSRRLRNSQRKWANLWASLKACGSRLSSRLDLLQCAHGEPSHLDKNKEITRNVHPVPGSMPCRGCPGVSVCAWARSHSTNTRLIK